MGDCLRAGIVSLRNQPPRPTQPSIAPRSVNDYYSYSWEGKSRYGSFRLRMNVWVTGYAGKTVRSLENTCHTWGMRWFWGGVSRRGAIIKLYLTFTILQWNWIRKKLEVHSLKRISPASTRQAQCDQNCGEGVVGRIHIVHLYSALRETPLMR